MIGVEMLATIVIDRSSRTKLFIQIADEIERFIRYGALPAETQLPNRREMARLFGVQHGCIDNAVRELRDRGLVRSSRGTPTMIQPQPKERLVSTDLLDDMTEALGIAKRRHGDTALRILVRTAYEQVFKHPLQTNRARDGKDRRTQSTEPHLLLPQRDEATAEDFATICDLLQRGCRDRLIEVEIRFLLRLSFGRALYAARELAAKS